MMKVLFRAGILLAGIFLAFGITKWLLKWLFAKVLFFAFWVAAIAVVVYVVYAIVKNRLLNRFPLRFIKIPDAR